MLNEEDDDRSEQEVVTIPNDNLTPTSELYITLDEFPLHKDIFNALRKLVVTEKGGEDEKKEGDEDGKKADDEDEKKAGDEDGKKAGNESIAITDATRSTVGSWIRANLRWRAVGVLESLLMHTEQLDRSLGRELYAGIAELLLRHAASCPRDDQLLPQMRHCDLLRQQLFNVCSPSYAAIFSAPPFPTTALEEKVVTAVDIEKKKAKERDLARAVQAAGKAELSKLRFVYGGQAYTAQRSGGELQRAENPMLDHYDAYVIPRIRFILRDDENFQNDLVLGDHMEQIRQNLRNEPDTCKAAMKAMRVAYEILSNGWISELVYPSPDHDWSTVAPERVRVGDVVEITERVFGGTLAGDMRDFRRVDAAGLSGYVKAIYQKGRNTQLLIQVYNPESMQLTDIWLPPDCLRPVEVPIFLYVNV
eukprot:719777-Amorphochlora_amoeboformis.AAC.2